MISRIATLNNAAADLVLLALLSGAALSAVPARSEEAPKYAPTPDRQAGEGEGPFERLVIRGATVIDGTGAPPLGPMDIVIAGNRIVEMKSVGAPGLEIDGSARPGDGDREIDAHGSFVLPGFVDLHTHVVATESPAPSEYAYKLWLAHGITTVRGVPLGPIEWALKEKARSARNEIVAPRIFSYHLPGAIGMDERKLEPIHTAEDARKFVAGAARRGIDGIKTGGSFRVSPEVMAAVWEEANKRGLGSTAHLGQLEVAQLNVADAARLGLGGMTHFYGLFEAMYENHDIQPWPADMNYNDEQHRFGQVARQWNLVKPHGEKWNALMDELIARDFYINPTMTIYSASRDLMRARNADWHDVYTLPSLMHWYAASRESHGSYWFYWTTEDEVAWKNYYRVWMSFLNEFKNKGGKVTLGSDSGFIYQLYGFGTILELELLQEAGFHPLEVVRAATMHSAMELSKVRGMPIEFGVLRTGMLADLFIVEENPLENFKVLYGTGAMKLNDETGETEQIGGIRYTVKDGIVYDAKELLRDVEGMVSNARAVADGN